MDDLNKLEEDIEKDVFQQKFPSTPNDLREAQEVEIISKKEGGQNTVLANISRINACEKLGACSMEFYSNLALVKNINAPDPSRASKGMGEFVATINKIHGTIVTKLQSEQGESEKKLQILENKLKNVTGCVIL